jgi:glucan biosynthesis protein
MIPDEMNKTLGQHRANSGVFMGRFEVQILDSFGADGLWNECGALYKVMPPHINASLPPLQWQTYDIEYKAPKYKNNKIDEYPEITVYHNGMQIHKDIKLKEGTEHEGRNRDISRMGDGPVDIKLQDHGNPIAFRNIWILEEK